MHSTSTVVEVMSDTQYFKKSGNEFAAVAVITSVKPLETSGDGAYFNFSYETPVLENGEVGHAKSIDKQFKKKSILSVSNAFICCFSRQIVTQRKEEIITPPEVALDDIAERVRSIEDFVKIQIFPEILNEIMRVLQGSILPQVNSGIPEIAQVFLDKKSVPSTSSTLSSLPSPNVSYFSFDNDVISRIKVLHSWEYLFDQTTHELLDFLSFFFYLHRSSSFDFYCARISLLLNWRNILRTMKN